MFSRMSQLSGVSLLPITVIDLQRWRVDTGDKHRTLVSASQSGASLEGGEVREVSTTIPKRGCSTFQPAIQTVPRHATLSTARALPVTS